MNNASLADEFLAQLQGAPIREISSQLGTSPQQASDAVSAALPMILGALGRNAADPQGAQALFGALNRDHGGMDLGSVLGGVLGSLGGAGARGAGGAGGAGGLGDLLGGAAGGGAGRAGGGLGDVLGGLLGGQAGGQAGGPFGGQQPESSAFGGKRGDLDGLLGHIFGPQQQRAESGLGQASGLGSAGAQTLLKVLAPMVMAFLAQRFTQGGRAGPGDLSQALTQERSQLQQQGGLGGGLMNAVLDQDGDGDVDINDLLKLGGSMLGGRR